MSNNNDDFYTLAGKWFDCVYNEKETNNSSKPLIEIMKSCCSDTYAFCSHAGIFYLVSGGHLKST